MALLTAQPIARLRACPHLRRHAGRLVRGGALACLLAAGCVRAGAAPGDEPTAAERARQCARAVLQTEGFQVRLSDPREPWVVIGERRLSTGPELVVVEIYPALAPDEPPMLQARVRGGRPGAAAGSDAEESARRVESRCGGDRRPR